ncbi:acyl-CoA dehydrogenase family protein [Pendulispora albinea]|uniref:Acyl-CoA dehydrogenase family protein n=1 Tax=Pendulispora albinea TaxID=2741071 RepID=A0ABZ2LTZ7_9BACT
MTTNEAANPTAADPMDPVRAMDARVAMIRSECADLDTTRAIPASVMRALQAAGVYPMLVPKELGGAEIDPVTFLRVVEAASYADGSVGWCVAISGCYGTFGGMLPAEGARRIFAAPATIVVGAFRPTGVATPVDGGYRVTGRWPFASGSTHATWYLGGCTIVRDGKPIMGPTGVPMPRSPRARAHSEPVGHRLPRRGLTPLAMAAVRERAPTIHRSCRQEQTLAGPAPRLDIGIAVCPPSTVKRLLSRQCQSQ